MAALSLTFTERAALLGERRSLVAIIARPVAPTGSGAPAIVILNTGIVHRTGHHRMYVTMSRLLASEGRTVVRFDFSGIGDSAPRTDSLPPLLASLADIKEVLDALEKTHQLARFILIGLCSGADHAVLYGNTDPRIVGLVLMDPTLPPTPRYYFHYVMQRLRHPRNWMSVATGRSGLARLLFAHFKNSVRPQNEIQGLTLQNLQFSPYLAKCYGGAAARGVRILSVFTCVSTRQTYRQQMMDAFPQASSPDVLRLEYFPGSDHLFSGERERTGLFRVIREWLGSS